MVDLMTTEERAAAHAAAASQTGDVLMPLLVELVSHQTSLGNALERVENYVEAYGDASRRIAEHGIPSAHPSRAHAHAA